MFWLLRWSDKTDKLVQIRYPFRDKIFRKMARLLIAIKLQPTTSILTSPRSQNSLWSDHRRRLRIDQWLPLSLFWFHIQLRAASLVAQLVKNLPAMQETWVQSLGWEDSLEKGKDTHSLFWPVEFHGLYSPWGCKESDTIECLLLTSPQLRVKWRKPSPKPRFAVVFVLVNKSGPTLTIP